MKGENVLFLALLIVNLLFVWIFPVFPTQDGPSHLDNANILLEHFKNTDTIFHEYYSLNTGIFTNWLCTLILSGLISILPIIIAEKVLVSGYVILLPVSMWYAIRASGNGSTFLSLLGFPFIYSYVLFKGFYSFCFGLPFFFFFIGYWTKDLHNYQPSRILGLIGLSCLISLWHVFVLIMLIVTVGIYSSSQGLGEIVSQVRRQSFSYGILLNLIKKYIIYPNLIFMPAVGLNFKYFLSFGGDKPSGWAPGAALLKSLLVGKSLIVFESGEYFFTLMLSLLFIILSLYVLFFKTVHLRWISHDAWFFCTFFLLLLYIIAPDNSGGGGHIIPRLGLFISFTLILWLANQSFHLIVKKLVMISAVVISVGLMSVRLPLMLAVSTFIIDYLSIKDLIKPYSTVLPLSATRLGLQDDKMPPARSRFLLHTSSYITAEKDCINLDNYEATYEYFPVKYRPKLNPQVHIVSKELSSGIESLNPSLDFSSYPSRTGGKVDYVFLWSYDFKNMDDDASQFVFTQLNLRYDLVATSSTKGLLKVYRQKNMEKNKLK